MSCSTTTTECLPASDRKSSAVRVGLVVAHARHRLVEEQQPRLLHEQHPDLEPLLLAVREQPGDAVGGVREPDLPQHRRRSGRARPIESFANSVPRTRLSAFIASSRFSNTVWCSKIVGFWNLRPMPACAISGSERRVRSIVWPKNAVPASGRVLPVMTSIIVVLPAPFGPITQRSSPTSIASERRFSALKPSKLTEMSSRYRTTPCAVSSSPEATRPARRLARSDAGGRVDDRSSAHRRPPRPAQPAREPDHALRQEQRHQDEQQAEEVQPVLGERLGEEALGAVDDRRRRPPRRRACRARRPRPRSRSRSSSPATSRSD